MLEINKIYQGNSAELLKQIDDNSVDLTVTSPPYDNLREYNGYSFDFESIAKELYRVTKDGGVVVWVVGDATVKGSESGTSFRQALFFKEIGFNLHDTMIYEKINPMPLKSTRYQQCFEYMFILTKNKIKTFNPIMIDCIHKGKVAFGSAIQKDGSRKKRNTISGNTKKINKNIFCYSVGRNDGIKHSAKFPEQLAKDHIISWSNKGDLVLDPFIGSGTTAKVSRELQRHFIGIEISKEYVEIAQKRLSQSVLFPLDTKQDGGNGIPA